MPKTKTSWKPGQSGNLKGGPKKGYSITAMMKELVASKVKNKKGKWVKVRKVLGNAILSKALAGDISAQRMIWQYMDGMPQQEIKTEGEFRVIIDEVLKK